MYHIASSFDVTPEYHQKFIDAALEDGRESVANEPGTVRFELIRDTEEPNRFYLNEVYENAAAFKVHCEGPYYERFFQVIEGFAAGPKGLIKGTRIMDEVIA
jgi:autoinducer 2-degrading protein